MTDPVIDEIWRIVKAALQAGQPRFQVQVFPFRLSEEALVRYDGDPRVGFWRDLKRGSDAFEAQWLPPRVHVCGGRYAFSEASRPLDGSQPLTRRCEPALRASG
jgi:murein L,D-transpeptidase YafK